MQRGTGLKKNEIIKINGTDYTAMTVRLLKAAGLADHIRQKAGPEKDPLIGIKPNLVSPVPAIYGATTHPEIVEGIILYLKENGYQKIMICEGSWVGDKTEDAFEYCGFRSIADRYGITLLDTQKDSSFSAKGGNLSLKICSCVRQIDFLINVPVLKGHCQTYVTCALKNMKGLIPNSEKRRFHALGLHDPIAALNSCIHQDFIIVDNICGDPDFEDGGNPLVQNNILAALDPVLTDAYACRVLDRPQEKVRYIGLSEAFGIGSADLAKLVLTSLDASGSPGSIETAVSSPAADSCAFLTHKAMELNYATEEIQSCSACYSALTDALNRLDQEGLLKILTEQLHVRFCIGQGYKGLSSPELSRLSPEDLPVGIGNCTCAFTKNIPGCPPSGDAIYEYLKALI